MAAGERIRHIRNLRGVAGGGGEVSKRGNNQRGI